MSGPIDRESAEGQRQGRVVLIGAKRSASVDASSKVIGQLLLQYAGVLQFGLRGVRHFATSNNRSAHSTKPKFLKTLTGGNTPPDAAWREMQKMGRKLQPKQVALYIALDAPPSGGLASALSVLASRHGLSIGVVSVLSRDKIKLWRPAQRNQSSEPIPNEALTACE